MTNFDDEKLKLKQKYDEERDKRMRSDGKAQYVKMEGKFAHFLEDPYVKRRSRSPMTDEVDVVVLGGGFGGLFLGKRLQEAGIEDFLIIEKGGDFGGTWYWNRYPGAACDVQSYIYLPMLEDMGYMPKERYARAPEIQTYSRMLGAKFDLYRRALFQTELTELRWDEEKARWIVSTDRGDAINARFVVLASGPLVEPKLPGIPGVEKFKGHSFHTSRWDYNYTGGNALGNLTKLKDKTVAIIGTGATAVQCVPHLGEWAKQLYVFQRTPSTVDIRDNRPTDPDWFRSLPPGWQKQWSENFTAIMERQPVSEDLIDDYWTKGIFATMSKWTKDMTPQQLAELGELADFTIMERIRARVDEVVKDKATAEALKPWYKHICKRPTYHDEYLKTFNRPNVTLVDTQGKGVERITEDALVVAGKEYKVDCLIYATGFDVAGFSNRAVIPVFGRGGKPLSDKWQEGATTLHGFTSHGFPNLLLLGITQAAWSANFPHMMDEQAIHIAYILKQMQEKNAQSFDLTEEAEQKWVSYHEATAARILQARLDCTPSYFSDEGYITPSLVRNGRFGGSVFEFLKIIEAWRAEGNMAGLTLKFKPSGKSDAARDLATRHAEVG